MIFRFVRIYRVAYDQTSRLRSIIDRYVIAFPNLNIYLCTFRNFLAIQFIGSRAGNKGLSIYLCAAVGYLFNGISTGGQEVFICPAVVIGGSGIEAGSGTKAVLLTNPKWSS